MPEAAGPAPLGRVVLVLASSAGGVGRHVRELADGLAGEPGTAVTVAGPAATDAAFGFSDSPAGLTFAPVEIADRPHPRADLAALRRLRRLLGPAEGRVGAVHAHGLRAGALAVLAARTLPRRRRPPVVVTLHNALVATGPVAVVHGILERVVARGAARVLVVSPDLADSIRARGAHHVARALVPAPPLPAPTAGPAATRSALGAAPGTALLLTVARLAPQKGLDHLLTAAGLMAREHAVRVVVAGGGPLEAGLRTRIAAEGLPVTLLGPREDVADLLAAADVVVVPSLWEGQPLIVQEALRAGAALVATDAGGTSVVAADGARLVPPGDPTALADAVEDLLQDPVGAAALRERARRRAADLPTAADAVVQVRELLRDAVRAT